MLVPGVGHVIRYAYLWKREYDRGRSEGAKDRPCAVVIATRDEAGASVLYVAPITHSMPKSDALAVEIPAATKRRLGLDAERSWIVTAETNRFVWPGVDIRPDARGEVIIGTLPGTMIEHVITNVRLHATTSRFASIRRTE